MKTDAFLIAKELGGQAVDSTKIENYMGYDFITGPELIAKYREQLVRSHYIDHVLAEVERIERADEGFIVTTSGLKRYTTRSVIITTGMTRKKLGVAGEERFQRKGLFYGNIQDLSFVQDKNAVVIGGGNSALQIVENLHSIAATISLVSATELTADRSIVERIRSFENVRIYEEYKVIELHGGGSLSGITIRKMAGDEAIDLPAQGAFIVLAPHRTERPGRDRDSARLSTSCPGLFAAGDITNAFGKRIIIASGEGAKAALAARQYLLDLRKKKQTAVCAS